MNEKLLDNLNHLETDIDGAIYRLSGDEALYIALLEAFTEDKTMAILNSVIRNRMWDEAFTAAHALKGLAGNLGLVPLYHSVGELVILIRTGRINEINELYKQVENHYIKVIEAIREARESESK